MAGADLSDRVFDGSGFVYVYDNEPRNQAICNRIEERIDSGNKVVIWPKDLIEKDINDMVLAGHDVQNVVESCTYSGLTATLKYKEWTKV